MCRFADAHLQSGGAALHFLLRVIISTRWEFSIPLIWGTDIEASWASVSISVQPCGCTANTSMSAFSMCGRSSAAAAALLTLVLKDRKVTLEHPMYSCALPLCLFSTPFPISHPILPSPSDAHSPKTPSYYGIAGLPCVCIYYVCVCVLLLIFAVSLWLWAPAVITAVWSVRRRECSSQDLRRLEECVCARVFDEVYSMHSMFSHCSFLLHLLLHLKLAHWFTQLKSP